MPAAGVVAETMKAQGVRLKYLVGTMIEVPRGALTADEVAKEAQFFSFGTNDLTQMTYGYSRDDIGKFLPFYLDKKLLPADPWQQVKAISILSWCASGLHPLLSQCVRLTVGTPQENKQMLDALQRSL